MLYINYFVAIFTWTILLSLRITMILLGLIIVPIALPFRYATQSDRIPTWLAWKCVRLPKWAWLWDNQRDGCLGDIRGQYAHEQSAIWMRKYPFLMAYNWLALRNPCNNFARFTPILSCNMQFAICETLQGKNYIKDKNGFEGFQFVRAVSYKGIPYWGLYYVSKNIKFGERHLCIRIGHKVSIKDNCSWEKDPLSAWKSADFYISFKGMD